MNIYEKLSAISTKLSVVAKNLEVGVGQGKYKAVGEADVLKAIKPLEAEFKIYSYPIKRTIIESGTIETENGKKQLFERIEVVYRFVNMEKPEEFIEITSYGDGIDKGDKSVGKAMTYADKYALMKAYKIITGDDPDQFPSEDLKGAHIKKELDPQLLSRCEELNIPLDKLAVYIKKSVDELTNEDLRTAINRRANARAKRLEEDMAKIDPLKERDND